MDVETNQPRPEISGRSKMVKIAANVMIVVIGLSTGAAIVHGMVYQQCVVKKVSFIAGVLPPDMLGEQEKSSESFEIQNCFDGTGTRVTQQEVDGFEAGVLPPEETAPQETQPSAQGSTPIAQPNTETATVNAAQPQSTASAPAPAPEQAQAPVPAPTPAPAPKAQPPVAQPAPAKTKPAKVTPAKTTPKTTTKKQVSVRPVTVNLDKLSIAVAMQETHNCKDTRGSALLNNCHGFRKKGKFMSFSTQAESHEYFKQLWVRSYGGGFPTYRLAQIYSGNDRPDNWLKNVTYYYNKL